MTPRKAPGLTCPVCAEPRAARANARSCGDGACRQSAFKRKRKLIRRFEGRHGKTPPRETIAAIAMRLAWKPGKWFTVEWAATAAARSGIHFGDAELSNFLGELVEDVLDETVTTSGVRLFTFPPPPTVLTNRATTARRSPRRAPKRGARAGASMRVTATESAAALAAPAPSAPQAQGHGREAAAPLTPVSVKMIAPPTIDGGTAFKLQVKAHRWNEQLRQLVEVAERNGWKAMRNTVPLRDDNGVVIGTPKVRRGTHGGITLEFEGEAQLNLYDRGGYAILIAKANALWVNGLESWMRTWFDRATWLLLGLHCDSPAAAAALGWKTRNIELCADFTGLKFFHADVSCFMGGGPDGPGCFQSRSYKHDGAAETIESGKRRRNVLSLGTHNKTQKVLGDKIRPEESVYSSTWRACGWDGISEIRRVELRADGSALKLTSDDEKLDLQSPDALLSEPMLRRLWRHATRRLCLAVPPKKC